ncbi:proprotein convertase P-domain-containing protein [Saccharothrix deserti]|uniref:proprotein convertase P-domain-containing protein n=1 Tax=Saccharothrix deserti TaxID=2593674 RepID=UPI00131C2F8C|nr:proprotein convertase P-domain-containing protein [Saccharothrix deserti]
MRSARRTRPRTPVAVATALALVATAVVATPVQADPPKKPGWSSTTRTKSVPGTPATARPRPADPPAEHALTAAPAVAWPKATTADVAVTAAAARVADTPVSVKAAGGPDRVRVEVLDRAAADKAGVNGVLFRVGRADAAQPAGPVTVEVDYSGFRHAFGGDYATRLSLVRLPACASFAPQRADCARGTPLPAHNDVKAGRLRGEVTVSGKPRAGDPENGRAALEPDALYAVTAAPSGSAGTFKPTSLAPSAMWQVGLQSGDFAWSYPLELPPVPGPEPELALSYSSGAIDGRTASTNNQSSWIGDGFDFQPGFIERQYTSCTADGGSTGDLCYASANAVVALPGVAGELVWDATKEVWRAEEDDGWRVEQLFGAANGDNDGEHWRLTSPDGTQYFFGRSAEARSAWTVPVYGNQAGEPCHAATFATSWCRQSYRWMLDHVVDRHGDAVAYFYDTETNHYGRDNTASLATPYVRAGHLVRIDYGLREGQEPAARVVFTPADRCVPGSACTRSQPADWPDVPWDQQCDGGTCTGKHSPVFFGSKRLAAITAQVRTGGELVDVDSWRLSHLFPSTEDHTSPGLWLESIVHTGHIGGTATLPEVNFDGVLLDNRVAANGVWTLRFRHTSTSGAPTVTAWSLSSSINLQASTTAPDTKFANPADLTIDGYYTFGSARACGVPGTGANDVRVAVDIRHPNRGDLKLELEAPEGAARYLLEDVPDSDTGDDLFKTYSVPGVAQIANGDWELVVRDTRTGNTGTIDGWSLHFGGLQAVAPGTRFENAADVPITDNGTVESTVSITGVTGAAPAGLRVGVVIRHPRRGDLTLHLVAPDGTAYPLEDLTGSGDGDDVVTEYGVNADGETANGTWRLRVADTALGDTGVVDVKHPNRGDLVLTLVAPDGTAYPVADLPDTDTADDLAATYWVDASGEAANGGWALQVRDLAPGGTGLIDAWSLQFGSD